MYALVARNEKGKKIQVINRNEDGEYLDRIVDATEGIYWIGSECCSLHVEPDTPVADTDGDTFNIGLEVYFANTTDFDKIAHITLPRVSMKALRQMRILSDYIAAHNLMGKPFLKRK